MTWIIGFKVATVAFLCQYEGMIVLTADFNHASTVPAAFSLRCSVVPERGRLAMADELKSFRRDWKRWSTAERLIAVTLLVLAALLGAPAAAGLF